MKSRGVCLLLFFCLCLALTCFPVRASIYEKLYSKTSPSPSPSPELGAFPSSSLRIPSIIPTPSPTPSIPWSSYRREWRPTEASWLLLTSILLLGAFFVSPLGRARRLWLFAGYNASGTTTLETATLRTTTLEPTSEPTSETASSSSEGAGQQPNRAETTEATEAKTEEAPQVDKPAEESAAPKIRKRTKRKVKKLKGLDPRAFLSLPALSNQQRELMKLESGQDRISFPLIGVEVPLEHPYFERYIALENLKRQTAMSQYYEKKEAKIQRQEELQRIANDRSTFLWMLGLNATIMLGWWSWQMGSNFFDHVYSRVWNYVNDTLFSSLSQPYMTTTGSQFFSWIPSGLGDQIQHAIQMCTVGTLTTSVLVFALLLLTVVHLYLGPQLGAALFVVDSLLAFFMFRESFLRMFLYGALGSIVHYFLAFYHVGDLLSFVAQLRHSSAPEQGDQQRGESPSQGQQIRRREVDSSWPRVVSWVLSLGFTTWLSYQVAKGDSVHPFASFNLLDKAFYSFVS